MELKELIRNNGRISFPIYLCAKEMSGMYTALLKDVDLTFTQYMVMNYFWEVGSSNLKDMSNVLMLDASTLSPIITKLVKKGYLQKKKAEGDERELVISPTESGNRIREQVKNVPDKVAEELEISEEDIHYLRELSCRLLYGFRKRKEACPQSGQAE